MYDRLAKIDLLGKTKRTRRREGNERMIRIKSIIGILFKKIHDISLIRLTSQAIVLTIIKSQAPIRGFLHPCLNENLKG